MLEVAPAVAPADTPGVVFVGLKARHCFSNAQRQVIALIEAQGVRGDVHFCAQPDPRNLRQVHLLQAELLDQLCGAGFEVRPGDLGENILTRGLPLPDLPLGTRLRLPSGAVLKLVGLRNPCLQLERFRKGLAKAVMAGRPGVRKTSRAGVLATVVASGCARPGHPIEVALPRRPHRPLPGI